MHQPKYPELFSDTLSANNDFCVVDPLHLLLTAHRLLATPS